MTEPSGQNGTRTDHERDSIVNGINGAEDANVQNGGGSKDKARNVAASALSNDEGITKGHELVVHRPTEQNTNRMNDLPDHIPHITQGFVPLSLFLTRLAQATHNDLQDKVAELAKMPVPASLSNGNSSYSSSGPDDSSSENMRKKGVLANFAQEYHGKWMKALVITEWSRNSHLVSKLIDLKVHIDQQRMLYDNALDNIVNVKRDLAFARMPSPDLKTALQVLSTGSAPWMPDLQYIEPPPLTPEQQLKWTNDLDTLLSLRLNLDDFDKIPRQFRDYNIESGRVTFKVEGEFEVDLTIADEDFEKQFWFIDFRYAFKPTASPLSESLRAHLEASVNDVLSREGLEGCYHFLHEFVLSSKINELKHQALQLGRTSWTGTLSVESLHRALAIQYWKSRSMTTGSKSWILIAVDSERASQEKAAVGAASQLVISWYRDGKEMRDAQIDFDVNHLSAEGLLTKVIALHVEHVLSSIYGNLSTAARYKEGESTMTLGVSKTNPASSVLSMQVGCNEEISLVVDPMTGGFSLSPRSKFTLQAEHQLNNGKNASEDGVTCLEQMRCVIKEHDLQRRSVRTGWKVRKAGLEVSELRLVTKMREWTRAVWLQREDWGPQWSVVVLLGLSGDEWWLLESDASKATVKLQTRLPLSNGHPDMADGFWKQLAFFTTGLIAQSVDLRELHRHRIKSRLSKNRDTLPAQSMRLPSIDMALSDIFPAMVFNTERPDADNAAPEGEEGSGDTKLLSLVQRASGGGPALAKRAWADNMVDIRFTAIEGSTESEQLDGDGRPGRELTCISEAVVKVRRPSKFASLTGLADEDVSYNAQHGEFSLRIRRQAGRPILDTLKSRIKAIDRFVSFLEAMDGAKGTITTESATLRQISFYYGDAPTRAENGEIVKAEPTKAQPRRWRVVLDLSKDDIGIAVEEGNPHLSLLDLLRRLVNSDGGMSALVVWLPASLPALRAVEEVASSWQEIAAAGQGAFSFSMKSIAWLNLTYTIGAPASVASRAYETVTLQVKLEPRRSQAWWRVWRCEAAPVGGNAISRALQVIWSGRGEGWRGLYTGVVARPHGGIEALLLAIDEVMRKCVGGGTSDDSYDVVVLD